jgi:hypothetical protein
MKLKLPLAMALVSIGSGCGDKSTPAPNTQSIPLTYQLPTASEVFRLRSECAHLGEKILEDNYVGPSLSQSQVSNYNERTNRCYVELTIQTAGSTKALYIHSVLYDGQTRELLAHALVQKDERSGMIFARGEAQDPGNDAGFSSTHAYIDRMMKAE